MPVDGRGPCIAWNVTVKRPAIPYSRGTDESRARLRTAIDQAYERENTTPGSDCFPGSLMLATALAQCRIMPTRSRQVSAEHRLEWARFDMNWTRPVVL